MKKLLILAAAVAMGVMNAQATALMADVNAFFETSEITDWANYSTVYFLNKDYYDNWKVSGDYDAMKENAIAAAELENVGDGNLYVRDFDLGDFSSNPTLVALLTDEQSYAHLTEYDFVQNKRFLFDNENSPITSTTPFAGAAPEPTSGLLLLLGVAGLALKRKRA